MTDSLCLAAEERFGIKADPDDVKKLRAYLRENYGGETPESIKKVFLSGEAAGFLTVNETYFFREPAHFAFLLDFLSSCDFPLHICSAATAAGCEAYSIAMLIEAYNRGGAKPVLYHIDAFDINPKVIETACRGFYSSRAMREDGSCFHYMAAPYLTKLADGYQVDVSLQKNIRFFEQNIMDVLPFKAYDIIFFRNAFIYFTHQSRGRILSNLSAALKDDGLLFLGVSETAGARHADLDEKNTNDIFYFQKKGKQARKTIF